MRFFRSSWRYLIPAGAIHIALTTAIFLIGHFRVLPNTFDENGIGLTFAIDGASYRRVASYLATEWQSNGFSAWLNASAPLHSRLHSLAFAAFGKILGHNILGAEPLNLFYYLAILCCIYFLGKKIFDARTGLIAAKIVALWPSFLIHSTQPIRDPLAILCVLALMLVFVVGVDRDLSWRSGIGLGILGALLVTVFWVTRGNMWNIVLVSVALTTALLLYRVAREKQFLAGNLTLMLLIIAAVLLVPARLESTSLPGVRPPLTPLAIPSASQPAPRDGIWTSTVNQIAQRRAGFRFYTSLASNIDADVQFKSAGDIVRFIPRALVIGFFAPFPNMWLQAGSFGRASRILSGLETLAMYFIYLTAVVCIWRERRNRKMWLLLLVAAIGILGLGLVVTNAGALYRIRYVLWMMLIVIGANGIEHLLPRRRNAAAKAFKK